MIYKLGPLTWGIIGLRVIQFSTNNRKNQCLLYFFTFAINFHHERPIFTKLAWKKYMLRHHYLQCVIVSLYFFIISRLLIHWISLFFFCPRVVRVAQKNIIFCTYLVKKN
uniref:Uncharacterized protein n=1 Tax=Cacopsylla melanoneura TaxID=428564 RepID=A0A8D8LMU7_9HEMI